MALIPGTNDWTYTVKWTSDGVISSVTADDISPCDPIIQHTVASINGLIDELRGLYSHGAPRTNTNLAEIVAWVNEVEPGFKAFLELSAEFRYIMNLRSSFLSS
jgi:hypothetical protein